MGFKASMMGCAVAAALAVTPAFADDAETGGNMYRLYCASCHGESGAGDGPVAAALVNGAPDLRVLERNNGGVFPEAVLRTVIDGRRTLRAHGTYTMPVWGRDLSAIGGDAATAQTINAIVEYLKGIQVR
ncbi:MAG TPA: cytochrome c [Pseudolabrys sp.]|nr:cytochrome c [Pseudolabrys sp.]